MIDLKRIFEAQVDLLGDRYRYAHIARKDPADPIPADPAIPSQPIFPVNH
jgi:hypothetical protein